jgi:hypothetical protein
MALGSLKNKAEQLRRRKESFIRKAFELGELYNVNIVVIICKNGRYFTYRLIEDESWLLTIKELISLYSCSYNNITS